MKLIRQSRLWFKDGKSDKVYEIDLCELGSNRYVVNFRYGRHGNKLREGSKTVQPVSLPEAEEIFTSLVVSKQNKGYQDSNTDTETTLQKLTTDTQTKTPNTDVDLLLLRLRAKVIEPMFLSRCIWRSGEVRLREAVPALIDLANSGKELHDYSVAWALGRCGDASALPILKKMHHGSKHESVRRIALESMLILADATEKEQLLQSIVSALPESLQQALTDSDRLSAALHAHLAHAEAEQFVVLEQLYRLASEYPAARAVLLEELRTAPLKPNYFQRIRHIFKAAELRLDSEVFGLLALRFETTQAYFYRSPWFGDHAIIPGEDYEYVRFSKEVRKTNSRLAYSNRTREHFRRRVWRTLRRLGELDDDTYVDMASGVLLAMSDDHAAEPRRAERDHYHWNQSDDDYQHSVTVDHYDRYAGFAVFGHILYTHSSRYQLSPSARAWLHRQQETVNERREEAFPELWDRQPGALLKLLSASRCEPVHQFAARALQDNQDYCRQLSVATLALLLRQPYPVTAELALTIARERYDPSEPDLALLEALLNAELEAARQQALQWLDASQEVLLYDVAFVIRLLLNRFAEVRNWAGQCVLNTEFSEVQTETLIARLLSEAMKLSADDDTHAAVATDLDQVLLSAFAERLRDIGLEVIEDLLKHPLEPLQVLAGRLLVNHRLSAEQLPPRLLTALLKAQSAEVRGLGVELFGQLSDQTLLAQSELLSAFCVAEEAEVRQSAHAITRRLAAQQPDYAQRIVSELLPYVFRKEPSENFHADLLALLQSDALAVVIAELDRELLWRLLKARAKAAQSLGGHLLQHYVTATELSVRQWAWLANHELLAVREWAWQSYRQHSDIIKTQAADGLRMLDSDWDDSRAFACEFFREHFAAQDWNPQLLVGICDSVREDIQLFGRELITKFFAQEHSIDYLLKLSQHPSTNVQLFVTQLLEQYAADNLERLQALTRYFVTVLSQVNRSRVAKQRILTFLQTEALKSEAAARIVAPIFTRQSATAAIEYKAACLQAMRDIHLRYPYIELPIAIKPTLTKPAIGNRRDGV